MMSVYICLADAEVQRTMSILVNHLEASLMNYITGVEYLISIEICSIVTYNMLKSKSDIFAYYNKFYTIYFRKKAKI